MNNIKQLGWGTPNTIHYYFVFDEASNLKFKCEFRINNVGLVSLHDYELQKPKGEYRIAIFGDSFTASLQMMKPWPDSLEEKLNKGAALKEKLGVSDFKVYNFGMYAGGFRDFVQQAKAAKDLDPDMVIVNFIAADFPRCNDCVTEMDNPMKDKTRRLVSGKTPVYTDEASGETAFLNMSCEQGPVSLDNDSCVHSFNLEIPPNLAERQDIVSEIKKNVIHRFLRGKLLTSLFPYSIKYAIDKKLSVMDIRHPDLFKSYSKSYSLTDQQQINQAVSCLEEIKSMYKGKTVLFTLNPTHYDLTWQINEGQSHQVMEKGKDIRITFMREFLPTNLSKEEYLSWYCLPYDGHMSDKGGRVYSDAMAALIRDTLTAETAPTP